MATLANHGFPITGGMSVDRIRSQDVLRLTDADLDQHPRNGPRAASESP